MIQLAIYGILAYKAAASWQHEFEESNKSYGYYAEPLIKKLSLSMYPGMNAQPSLDHPHHSDYYHDEHGRHGSTHVGSSWQHAYFDQTGEWIPLGHGNQGVSNQFIKQHEDPEMEKLRDELLMYKDPSAYKARKEEQHAQEEAWHIATLKDPQAVKRYYEKEDEQEAEQREKILDPIAYERKQIEKQKAEFKALQDRSENPEYIQLLADLSKAKEEAQLTSLWQTQQASDQVAASTFQLSKYQDPEWQRLQSEKKSREWREDLDFGFQQKKQRYEMTKSYAELIWKANPQWVQAKSQYQMADCKAHFSRFTDPNWQAAKRKYSYYKDFGLDQSWNPQYVQAKQALDKIERDLKYQKRRTQPCAGYYQQYKAIEEQQMKTYFSTPELQAIRQEVEAADVKEDELEQKLEDREYGLAMQAPASTLSKPAPVFQPYAATTYTLPQAAKQQQTSPSSQPSKTTNELLNAIDYDQAIREIELQQAELAEKYQNLVIEEENLNQALEETINLLQTYDDALEYYGDTNIVDAYIVAYQEAYKAQYEKTYNEAYDQSYKELFKDEIEEEKYNNLYKKHLTQFMI